AAQDSWGRVYWELPSEVSSILAEAWFSECRGLLREVGQAQSFGRCSPMRGSNSCQTARRAWTPRLLTTNDQNIPNRYRGTVPGNTSIGSIRHAPLNYQRQPVLHIRQFRCNGASHTHR